MEWTPLPKMHLDPRYGDLIFDHIPHGIFTVNGRGEITSFNRAAEEITGYSAGEAVGRPCHEVFRATLCGEECPMRQALSRVLTGVGWAVN